MPKSLTPLAVFFVLMLSAPAAAQIYESVGTRAKGMGGAFVAVADDATATWWNPAGLATGSFLSAVLERGTTTTPRESPAAGPADRTDTGGFALSFPALGVSYYRLGISEIAPDTVDSGGAVDLRKLTYSQFGATVGQSLGRHFVVATTLKLVRVGAASGRAAMPSERDAALERADDLETDASSHGDLDLGAMAAAGPLRVGVALKHATAPTVGSNATRVELKRQARAGLALTPIAIGPLPEVTLAADIDLTKTQTADGDVRHFAVGAETWLGGRRVALRTGWSVDTAGPVRSTGTAGASVRVPFGLWLDAAVIFGEERARNGWSTGVSVTF